MIYIIRTFELENRWIHLIKSSRFYSERVAAKQTLGRILNLELYLLLVNYIYDRQYRHNLLQQTRRVGQEGSPTTML